MSTHASLQPLPSRPPLPSFLDAMGKGDGMHEALLHLRSSPASSYIAVQGSPPSSLGSSSSSPTLGNGVQAHPSSPYSATHRGTLQDGGLEAVRQILAQGESNLVFLKFRADFVLLQCISDELSGVRRAKALVHARTLLSLAPFNAVPIQVSSPSKLSDWLIRSKLTQSDSGLPVSRGSVGSSSSKDSTGSASPPDVPQDASTFADSPQMGSHNSEAAPSSPMPDTPPPVRREMQRFSFLDELDSYDEGLSSSLAFLVKTAIETSPALSSESFSHPSHPFPMPPDREAQRREEERKRIGIPTPVQEESGDEQSTTSLQTCRLDIKDGTLADEKSLPPIPETLHDNDIGAASISSSNLSWVLESGLKPTLHKAMKLAPQPARQIPPRLRASVLSQGTLTDLEQERIDFLAWKEEQEASMLAKEKDREQLRRTADEAKRERVLKKLMQEQQTWTNGRPPASMNASKSVGNSDSAKSVSGQSNAAPSGGQRAGSAFSRKKGRPPPLSPPPNIPPPKSPVTPHHHRLSFPGDGPKTPVAHQFTHQSSLASLTGTHHHLQRGTAETVDTARLRPVITLEGHIRSRAYSQGSAFSSKYQRGQEDKEVLDSMPPFLASIEIARRKAKKLEQEGLEGESWLTKRNRERIDSDVEAGQPGSIPVGKGWRLTEVEGVKVGTTSSLPSMEFATLHAEALEAHQRSLDFEMSELQRREKERNTAEGLQRAKWAREQVALQRLDAFERSKREAAEKRRRAVVEELRKEEESKRLEIKEQQAEARRRIEEDMAYREKLERANRQRKAKMEEEERSNRARKLLAKEKVRAKAQRREAISKELEALQGPLLASGIITLQSEEQLKRRQRWFELQRHALILYPETRSPARMSGSDSDTALDTIYLDFGSIVSLSDAFEELQAPHSFCLRYRMRESTEEKTLMAYTTCEEAKERLVVGLSQVTGFRLNVTTI